MTFDVAVVGAGIAGAAAAWRFAQRGLRVGLFDRLFERAPAHARSGPATPAAAGILCAQVEGDGPGPFFDLLRAAEAAHARLAAELSTELARATLGYRTSGVLRVACDAAELEGLARERGWQRALGLPVEALDAAALRALEPALSSRLVGASLFPSGGQVDPRALLAALLDRGAGAGVVRVAADVAEVRVEAGRVEGLGVAGERVPAPLVVVAAGAWSAGLRGVGLAPRAIEPVRGQMLELAAPPAGPSRVVFGAGGYLVPRGGRVLVGSTMERVGFEAGLTADAQAALRARAARLCPGLDGQAPIDAWYGFRPATPDGLPALGPTPIAGLHLAVGFLRNGILLAPLAAELLVRAALDDPGAIPRPFAAARLLS